MKAGVFLAMLAACGGKAGEKTAGTGPAKKIAALGALMKNDINPPFSRLTFLVFHGDSMGEDGAQLAAEMRRYADALRASCARLKTWQEVPAGTQEAREVFYTFAESVDKMTDKLVAAVTSGDLAVAETQLERIADTCNNCHHFFRLDIEDSVVPAKSARASLTSIEPAPDSFPIGGNP